MRADGPELTRRTAPVRRMTCQVFTICWFNLDHYAMYVRGDVPAGPLKYDNLRIFVALKTLADDGRRASLGA